MELTLIMTDDNDSNTYDYNVIRYKNEDELFRKIKQVDTEYICILGDNDLLSPVYINNNEDVMYFNFIYEGNYVTNLNLNVKKQPFFARNLFDSVIGINYCIFKSELIRELKNTKSLVSLSLKLSQANYVKINLFMFNINSFIKVENDLYHFKKLLTSNIFVFKSPTSYNKLSYISNNLLKFNLDMHQNDLEPKITTIGRRYD